jgi:hypothetical protein
VTPTSTLHAHAGGRPLGRPLRVACALVLLATAPLAAQAPSTSAIRFGIAYASATPRGGFATFAEQSAGFSSWVTLPLARGARLGIRGEFTIFTIPEARVVVPTEGIDEFAVTLRSTVGFTGAGPRITLPVGPFAVEASVMGGLARVIADVAGQARSGAQRVSVSASESENVVAAKASLDLYLPLVGGPGGAAVALTGGFDWATSAEVGFVESGGLRLVDQSRLEVATGRASAAYAAWRLGLGLFF